MQLIASEFPLWIDFRSMRGGEGGSREDITHYEQAIPI